MKTAINKLKPRWKHYSDYKMFSNNKFRQKSSGRIICRKHWYKLLWYSFNVLENFNISLKKLSAKQYGLY